MRKTYRKKKPKPSLKFRANEKIQADEVRVINKQEEMLGVFPIEKAIEMAEEAGLDLVEVSPKANPPVTRIMDYGSFKYKQEKLKQKQKSAIKKVEIKNLRLSLRISEHDEEVKIRQAKKFLSKGSKLKLELALRGREHQHTEAAKDKIQEFIDKINEEEDIEAMPESPIKKMGGKILTVIYNKKA